MLMCYKAKLNCHIFRRWRGSDNRIIHEVIDILAVFTVLDEHKLIEKLARYVAESPDTIPSTRFYEGDLITVTKLMEKMDVKFQDLMPS